MVSLLANPQQLRSVSETASFLQPCGRFGLCGAVTVLASQYYGSGNMAGIRRTLAQSWCISILVTLPFIVLYAIFDEEIVSFMSDDPEYVTMHVTILWLRALVSLQRR